MINGNRSARYKLTQPTHSNYDRCKVRLPESEEHCQVYICQHATNMTVFVNAYNYLLKHSVESLEFVEAQSS